MPATRIRVSAPALLRDLAIHAIERMDFALPVEVAAWHPGSDGSDAGALVHVATEAEGTCPRAAAIGVPIVVLDLADGAWWADADPRAIRLRPTAGIDRLRQALDRSLARRVAPADALLEFATPSLSPREESFLRLYAAGLLFKQIASEMGLSLNTVKSYRARIQSKYRLAGRSLGPRLDFHIEARRRFPDFRAEEQVAAYRAERLREGMRGAVAAALPMMDEGAAS